MNMEISLQSVDIDLMDSERAVFKVLKATLEYPTDVRVKAQKLADDINFFCKSRIGNIDEGEILWQLWGLLLDITCCIPPGHPWQECLVQALDSLRQRDGAIPGYGEVREATNQVSCTTE